MDLQLAKSSTSAGQSPLPRAKNTRGLLWPQILYTPIYWVAGGDIIQYHAVSLMDTKRLPTRWLFILDYLDEDTGAVAATIGSADDRDECESAVRHEATYYQRQGFTILRSEACEICRTCDGDGILSDRGITQECPACGGFAGSLRKLRFKV